MSYTSSYPTIGGRTPTVREIQHQYLTYGTHVASTEDIPVFTRMLKQLHQAPGAVDKKYSYLGWLHYECATISERCGQVALSQLHYQKARHGIVSAVGKNPSPRMAFGFTRNKLMMDLSSSTVGCDEASVRLNRRATIKALGHQVVGLTNAMHDIVGDRELRAYLCGELSEVAFAATLLSMSELGAPSLQLATPRQDAPWREDSLGFDLHAPTGVSIGAFDYVLHAVGSDPRKIQVKSRLHHDDDDDKYDPDITVLYSDRDLFLDTKAEFIKYGRALVHYAHQGEITRPLEIAYSNIELAFETRDEQARFSA